MLKLKAFYPKLPACGRVWRQMADAWCHYQDKMLPSILSIKGRIRGSADALRHGLRLALCKVGAGRLNNDFRLDTWDG